MVCRAALPEPVDATIEAVQALPDRPEMIVVSEEEDPADRAKLLIAGCSAVLNAGLAGPMLRDAFDALVTRQREQMTRRLQYVI